MICFSSFFFFWTISIHELLYFILQIVAEKTKFRKNPFNYAMKKNQLLRSKVNEGNIRVVT